MRILTVTHVFPRGVDDAVAPFLLDRARLLRGDHDLAVLAPHAPGLPERHDVDGVEVRRVRYARESRERIAYRGNMHRLVASPAGLAALAGLYRALGRAVAEEAARFRPDVLDVHWAVPAGIVVARAGVAVPLHLTLHGTDVALVARLPGHRLVARWLSARAGRIVAVSDGLAADAEAAGFRVDGVVPTPLRDVTVQVDDPGREPRVLAVGRLVPEKGHADLLHAVAELPAPRPRVEIVGEGPQAGALRRLASDLGLDLTLPGALAPRTLDAHRGTASCVVVPSRREGLGLVALEAMLAGVPVVATRVGGLAVSLGPDDAPRGFGVPPGDIPALTDAIAEALTSRDAGVRAERARAYARGERDRSRDRTVATLAAAAQGVT